MFLKQRENYTVRMNKYKQLIIYVARSVVNNIFEKYSNNVKKHSNNSHFSFSISNRRTKKNMIFFFISVRFPDKRVVKVRLITKYKIHQQNFKLKRK